MLHLILGRAGTGKSYAVFENIKSDVEKGKSVVLLVPEQFTFECERTLLHTLGNKASTNAQVLSFTRLYDEISRKVGGRVADVISENDRAVLMGQALKISKDHLKLWGKYVNSVKFSQSLLSTITEFKSSAISYQQLSSAAETVESDYLSAKLHDVAVVYEAYNALLGERFLDPQDNLGRLYNGLLDYKFFENKTVYVDSFKNFTGQQYKIIDRLISQADNVTFCFTTPDLEYGKLDLFTGVRETVQRVVKIAENNGKHFEKANVLTEFHFKNESLKYIESVFSDNHTEVCDNVRDITVCECDTVYDEAEFAARTIRKLVRRENYRYRDFVIIARSAEKYQRAVETACKKNGVFCFSDKRVGIKNMPLTVFINSYLKLLNHFKTENIFEMLRTGLSNLTDEEICELENYVYIWSIDGETWLKEWDMNPEGFSMQNEKDIEKNSEILEALNNSRKTIVNSILNFRKNFCGTPANMATAIVKLTDEISAGEKLKNIITETLSGTETEDYIKQGYDAVMNVLDGIVKCLPDKEITVREFINNWDVSISNVTVGNIPQMLDEVTFGSADRIKPSRPKIAFIIGAYQDEFPKSLSNAGIFASREREILKAGGLEIYSTDISKAVEEDYLVYTSLCCASERVYVTYPTFTDASSGALPSVIVNNIKSSFPCSAAFLHEPDSNSSVGNLPETAKSAVAKMCGAYNTDKNLCMNIEAALKNTVGICADDYLKSADKQKSVLSKQVANELFGNNIAVSATKFETFHKCKFMFFCKYGLGAKSLKKADLNVLQRGTLVHFVIEQMICEYGKDVGKLSREETDNLVDRYVEEYISQVSGAKEYFDNRMRYLVSKISIMVKDIAYHIACEFAQSDFSPEYCELKIGRDGTVPSKKVACENGKNMYVEGSIDRVDVWNSYVRVVDYKTGKKTFKLSDALLGLNMQMLLYMYALVRGENKDFNKLSAAGILYVPVRRNKKDKDMAMNGMIVDEERVYTAMEKENCGEYIPKHDFDKNGEVKGNTYVSSAVFDTVFDYIEKLLHDMAKNIENGNVKAIPTDSEVKACEYCDYYSVCCNEKGEHIVAQNLKNAQVLEKMKEEL